MAGIQSLYLFRIYQTREDFEKLTGLQCPAYDPSRDIKSWRDDSAIANPKPRIVYDRVLAYGEDGRTPALDADGKPYFEPLILPREIAASVNIPPKDFSGSVQEQPTTGREVPCPCRELGTTEFLRVGFGANVEVFDTTDTEYLGRPDQVLNQILDTVRRIEAKIDAK